MIYSIEWKPESGKDDNCVLILACFDSRLSEYNKYYDQLQKGLETGLACIDRNITLDMLERVNQDNSDDLSISYPLQLVGFILGSELKRHHIAFRILTATTYDEFLDQKIYDDMRKERYSHIFFTTTYIQSFSRLKYISGRLRELFPASKIVAGGQLLSYNKSVLECPDIDFFVIGDGEETGANIVLHPEKYISSLNAPNNRGTVVNAPMKDLSLYPSIDYDLLWNCIPRDERERFKNKYYFPMETVRGCYFKCAFCSSSTLQGNTRIKSADKLLEEIQAIHSKGITKISIWDSNFTAPPSRVKELCHHLISKNINESITFQSYARLSDLDEEMLTLMIKAGWRLLYVGIESGSERVLRKMNKGLTRKMLLEKLSLLSGFRDKIDIFPSFMIGFPGEDEGSMADTYEIIKQYQFPYINIQPLDVRRGSTLFLEPEKFGLRYDMNPDDTISYRWEHDTMNSLTATDYALNMFCKVAVETDTILLENLLGTTRFTLRFPPFNNQRNSSVLRTLQKTVALGLQTDKGSQQTQISKEKVAMLWDRLCLKAV